MDDFSLKFYFCNSGIKIHVLMLHRCEHIYVDRYDLDYSEPSIYLQVSFTFILILQNHVAFQ
jgi:hypothetical protein